MTAGSRLRSPSDILPFSDLGYPVPGRYLLTLDQVKDAFVDAEVFAASTTRRRCWEGLISYLQLWSSFASRFDPILDGSGRLTKCLWLGGSFIGTAKLDPNNVDLVLFIQGEVLERADRQGISYRAMLDKLVSRDRLERMLAVTPTVVRYWYPGSPWQRPAYTGDQESYMTKRGALDDWWTRSRPPGLPKGPPNPDTGEWVRGYVEVTV